MERNRGITIISLIITIIILIIIAGVIISFAIKGGIIGKAENAKRNYEKQEAIEVINLKITNLQIESYKERNEEATLQYLADGLYNDNQIEYVTLKSDNIENHEKIDIGENTSFFTKLKKYPYQFEINNSLTIVYIDGNLLGNKQENYENKNTWEKLLNIVFTLDEIINNEIIFNKTINKEEDIKYMINDTSEIMPIIVNSQTAIKKIATNKEIYKYIFGDTEEKIPVNETWMNAILKNKNAIEGLDNSNPITIPNMTGYKSSNGEASESSYLDTNYGWKAFNNATSTTTDDWHSANINNNSVQGLPQWIQYKFDKPVIVYKFYMQNRNQNSTWVNAPQNFTLQASNDGESWNILGTYTNTKFAKLQSNTYIVSNINDRYLYYRINITSAKRTDGATNVYMTSIGRLQFYAK